MTVELIKHPDTTPVVEETHLQPTTEPQPAPDNKPKDAWKYRLRPITLLAVLAELTALVVIAMIATRQMLVLDETRRLIGLEAEFLTAVGYEHLTAMQSRGFPTFWMSWTGLGEPTFNNVVSFLFNPFSMGPLFLFGFVNGVKIGLVVAAVMVATGGWVLGRVLNLGSFGRILLGLLCLGKGGFYALITVLGTHQLTLNQAYFPWLLAGFLAIFLLPHRRWPIILTSLSFGLLILSAGLWFALSMLLMMGVITFFYLFPLRVKRTDGKLRLAFHFNGHILGRVVLAGALSIGFSMAIFLPTVVNFASQPYSLIFQDVTYPPEAVLGSLFNENLNMRPLNKQGQTILPVEYAHFYNYIMPPWLLGICIVCTLPVLWQLRKTPHLPIMYLSLWGATIFLLLYAIDLNPIMDWAYSVLPLLDKFRHSYRVLGAPAFLITVIAALHANAAWEMLVGQKGIIQRIKFPTRTALPRLGLTSAVMLSFIGVFGVGVYSPIAGWSRFTLTEKPHEPEYECVKALRNAYPTEYLSAWTLNYITITPYQTHRVRHRTLVADYAYHLVLKDAVYVGNLAKPQAQFAVAQGYYGDYDWAINLGYKPLENVACPRQGAMIYTKPTLPYAFTGVVKDVNTIPEDEFAARVTPISTYNHQLDHIAVIADANPKEAVFVSVQELLYPEWRVFVDGKPAKIESVGGLIGVVLPPGEGERQILFQFYPQTVIYGVYLTLLTCLIAAAFLLRAERLIPASVRQRFISSQGGQLTLSPRLQSSLRQVGERIRKVLLNPRLFEERDQRDQKDET
jgi:hypothetical protein